MADPNPVDLQEYHIFLASPGDVDDERKAVHRYFDQFNRTTARPNFNVQFTVIDWENYSSIGVGRPQELITAQTLERYRDSLALVIGIMGQRFGTPTGEHGSGTEEEFHWALQNHVESGFPEIKWFFRKVEKFAAPSADIEEIDEALDQWKKVTKFRASFQERSDQDPSTPPLHYKEYLDLADFRDAIANDLNLWLNDRDRPWTSVAPSQTPDGIVSTAQPSREYYQSVVNDFQWLDIAGIDNDRSFRIPLSDMYVRLRVMMDEDALEDGSDYDGGAIDIQTALARYNNLVIVGDPGSGKSTFLRFIALMISRAIREHDLELAQSALNLDAPLPIPIFVSLWDLADFSHRHAKIELALLTSFIQERLASMGNEIGQEQLETWLEEGRCALLFDGLDEVPTDSGRALVSRLVENCVDRYPKNRYVITSRVRAYTGDTMLRGDFVRCDIQPFNQQDRAEFLRNWAALLFQTPPDEVETAGSDSAREFTNLIDAVEHNERIRTLAINPLLLTVVAIVHWNRKRLPEQRVDLYDECIDVLLGQRKEAEKSQISRAADALDSAQEESKHFDRSWVRKRFAEIALQIMVGGEEEISKQRVVDLLVQRFLDRGAASDERAIHEAERFLEQQELRSGLLVSRRASTYRFVHLTFQEYLAAWNLATREPHKAFTEIRSHLREQKWFESLVLLGGEWARRSDDILDQYIAFLLAEQGASIEERAPVVALCANILSDINEIAQIEPETQERYEAALQDTLHAFDRRSGVAVQTQLEILAALAHLGNAVKPQLMNATRSKYRDVRSASLALLIPHLPDDDLFSLTYLLQDRSNETIRIYLGGLVERDPMRAIGYLESVDAHSGKLGDAISRMADSMLVGQSELDARLWAIVANCAELNDDWGVRWRAMEFLAKHSESVERTWTLAIRLAERDPDRGLMSGRVWELLVKHRGSEESTWTLATGLSEQDRRRVLELLAEHRGSEESTWTLATKLAEQDSDRRVRLSALELLAEHRGSEESTWTLITKLAEQDSDRRVRQSALKLLAEYRGSEESTWTLITRLAEQDPYGWVRETARRVLVVYQWRNVDTVSPNSSWNRRLRLP